MVSYFINSNSSPVTIFQNNLFNSNNSNSSTEFTFGSNVKVKWLNNVTYLPLNKYVGFGAIDTAGGGVNFVIQDLKFVKTSQNTQVNDFKKLLPEWDISDVLKSMSSVANKTDIADAEKQQSMINILSQYEKSIAPLSQFLDKNDIKYK
jgi:hypothetical protein